MGSMVLAIFVFWIWPARDIAKTRKIKGIGLNEDAKLDQATVEGWKAGRIRAKKLWVGFGSFVVAGSMLNFVIEMLWQEDGMMPNPQMASMMSKLLLTVILIGLLGFFAGLIYSGCNNKKYLGQLRVTM